MKTAAIVMTLSSSFSASHFISHETWHITVYIQIVYMMPKVEYTLHLEYQHIPNRFES